MLLLSFAALTVGLISQYTSRIHTDDVERMAFVLASRSCLVISLILAPWIIKVLILAAVFVIPTCVRGDNGGFLRCSEHCIARSTCSHPHA
jgi:hypothetical protein